MTCNELLNMKRAKEAEKSDCSPRHVMALGLRAHGFVLFAYKRVFSAHTSADVCWRSKGKGELISIEPQTCKTARLRLRLNLDSQETSRWHPQPHGRYAKFRRACIIIIRLINDPKISSQSVVVVRRQRPAPSSKPPVTASTVRWLHLTADQTWAAC